MFTTVPNPPTSTKVFPDLKVKELLRFDAQPFKFLVESTWERWLILLAKKCQPIIVKATLDFPNTVAQSYSDIIVPVEGADVDHAAEVAMPATSIPAGACSYWAFVSSIGSVTVRFINASAGPLNPASGEFTIVVRT